MATITASAAGGNFSSTASWEGAKVPGKGDDVVLGAGSGSITVTANAECRSLEASAYKKTLKIEVVTLKIGEATANGVLAMKLGAGMVFSGAGGVISFNSTSKTTLEVTTAGLTITTGLTFQSSGGKYKLADKLTCSGAIKVLSEGELNFNNQAVSVLTLETGETGVLSCGTTVCKVTGTATTVMKMQGTLHAEEGTFEITGVGPNLLKLEGKTYNNITIASDNNTIEGNNTIATLTINNKGGAEGTKFLAGTTQTITTITTNASLAEKVRLVSSVKGSLAKLKKAATTVELDNLKLRDMEVEGGVEWKPGEHTEDYGNNVGWAAFDHKTLHPSVVGGLWSAGTAWSGSGVPRPNDDVILDEGGSIEVTAATEVFCRSLEITAAYAKTFKLNATSLVTIGCSSINGSAVSLKWAAGPTITLNATSKIKFAGSGAQTAIRFAGREPQGLTFEGIGSWLIAETTTVSGELLTTIGGKLEFSAGVTVEASKFGWTLTEVTANTATFIATSTAPWVYTSGTLSMAEATIEMTNATETAKKFVGGNQTYGKLVIATDNSVIEGNNTFTTIEVNTRGKSVKGTKFLQGSVQTVTTFKTNATGAEKIKILSTKAATRWKLKKANSTIILKGVEFTDAELEGGAVGYVEEGVSVSNNSVTWHFEAAPTHTHTLSIEQAQTVAAPKRELSRTLTASQAQTVATTATVSRTLTASQGQAPSVARIVYRTLTASQGQTVTSTATPTRVLSVSQAQSVSLTRTLTRTLSISQGQAVVKTATVSRTLTASQGQTVSKAATVSRTLAISQGQSATLRLVAARTLAVEQLQSVHLAAALSRTLTASQAQSVTKRATVSRILSVGQGQTVARTVNVSRTLSTSQEQTVTLSAEVHRAGNEVVLEASQGQSVSLTRALSRILSVSQGQAVARTTAISRTLSASQAQAVTLRRALARTLTVSQSQSAAINLTRFVHLTVSQEQAVSLRRGLARILTVSATQSATLESRHVETLLSPFDMTPGVEAPQTAASATDGTTIVAAVESPQTETSVIG